MDRTLIRQTEIMKSRLAVGIASALVIMLSVAGMGFVTAKPQSPIALGLAGAFVNIGSQEYHSTGNNATLVSILGTQLPHSSYSFSYSINASVHGTSVSGAALFELHAAGAGETNESDGGQSQQGDNVAGAGVADSNESIVGQVQLVDMVPAFGLPITDATNPLACLPSCTSEVPGYFIGMGSIQGNLSGHSVSLQNVSVLVESAYLNPFGGPLFIGTADGSVSIATTYDSAISQWSGVKTGGAVLDTSGNQIGQFGMTSRLTEDLLSGNETDHGQIAMSGFVAPNAVLNSQGEFHGMSMIPTAIAGFDCTSMVNAQLNSIQGFSITLPAGTCSLTGSHSAGSFMLHSLVHGKNIKGDYSIDWYVPAIGFQGTVTARVV